MNGYSDKFPISSFFKEHAVYGNPGPQEHKFMAHGPGNVVFSPAISAARGQAASRWAIVAAFRLHVPMENVVSFT